MLVDRVSAALIGSHSTVVFWLAGVAVAPFFFAVGIWAVMLVVTAPIVNNRCAAQLEADALSAAE